MYLNPKRFFVYQALKSGRINEDNAYRYNARIIREDLDSNLIGPEYFLDDISDFTRLVVMLDELESSEAPFYGSLALFFDKEGNLIDVGRTVLEAGGYKVSVKFLNYEVTLPEDKVVIEKSHTSILFVEDPF